MRVISRVQHVFHAGSLLVLGLAGLVGGCKPPPDVTPIAPSTNAGEVVLTPEKVAAAGITVQALDEQNVEDTIITSGRVTFDDLKVAHIFSPVNGRVTEIYASLGERVKKG